jgi:hypothetical protein
MKLIEKYFLFTICLILSGFTASSVWASPYSFANDQSDQQLARIIRAESDFGWPSLSVRVTFEIPCGTEIDHFIHYPAEKEKKIRVGVMLTATGSVENCEPTGEPAQAEKIFSFPNEANFKVQVLGAREGLQIVRIPPLR